MSPSTNVGEGEGGEGGEGGVDEAGEDGDRGCGREERRRGGGLVGWRGIGG